MGPLEAIAYSEVSQRIDGELNLNLAKDRRNRSVMLSKPTISVVLPIYNGARYLRESVQSILKQTFTDWELILVDDGSTDESPQLIDEFCELDERIISIRNETNQNLPASLNRGFDIARGQYFTWTSHDNQYRPHAFKTMHQYLVDHPDVDLVYADYAHLNEAGDVTGYTRVPIPERLVMKSSVGACFLYKRKIHEEIGGYDTTKVLVEDYDFWLRASMKFKLQPLSNDLYLYRFHASSLTTTRRKAIMEKRAELLHELLPKLPWATPRDRALGYLHLADVASAFDAPASPFYYALQAFKANPITVIRHVVRVSIADPMRRRQAGVEKSRPKHEQ
ncbi:MAG: glycosyltransferase family 2 protein [Anaerolineae bacterium]|nr:glycosyltransferase family 2 protein [Anaerolineae bacterium]